MAAQPERSRSSLTTHWVTRWCVCSRSLPQLHLQLWFSVIDVHVTGFLTIEPDIRRFVVDETCIVYLSKTSSGYKILKKEKTSLRFCNLIISSEFISQARKHGVRHLVTCWEIRLEGWALLNNFIFAAKMGLLLTAFQYRQFLRRLSVGLF